MIETIHPKFERMVGQRVPFSGKVDEVIKQKNGKITIILVDVKEKCTNDEFRDHVHILVENANSYKKEYKLARKGDVLEFTAVINKYKKLPKNKKAKYLYQIENLGLNDLKKVINLRYDEYHKDIDDIIVENTDISEERLRSLYSVVNHLINKGYMSEITKNGSVETLVIRKGLGNKIRKSVILDIENLNDRYKDIYLNNTQKIINLLTINYKQYIIEKEGVTEKLSKLKLEKLLVKDLNRYGLFV